ncbi:hypothetical protein BDF22DRAFT_663477 [Syncephalis plumigaleata]|nr:hypothetical protein BDF22DRAFT_663477 [Syncephalis plumigaleata]
MSHHHHSFVSLLSQSPVLVLTVFVLLWLQTTVEAALLLDWVTGFQITVPTAVWYTSKSEFHSHFTVRDARALLITMNEECKPEWPSISENQMETGWAILKDTLVVVTFDDNEGHPLSSHCASHMDVSVVRAITIIITIIIIITNHIHVHCILVIDHS